MILRKQSISPLQFGDLSILDYTAGQETSASLAVIEVGPGAQHPPAYSTRSDKYYYVQSGRICFTLEGVEQELAAGDCCCIPREQVFAYANPFADTAVLLLFHTPSFDLSAEVFLDG